MSFRPNFSSKGRGDFRLIVENMDKKTSWQDLKDFARQAGDVAYTDVWTDDGEKFGAIEYLTEGDYETALRKLDGTLLEGRKVRLVPVSSF